MARTSARLVQAILEEWLPPAVAGSRAADHRKMGAIDEGAPVLRSAHEDEMGQMQPPAGCEVVDDFPCILNLSITGLWRSEAAGPRRSSGHSTSASRHSRRILRVLIASASPPRPTGSQMRQSAATRGVTKAARRIPLAAEELVENAADIGPEHQCHTHQGASGDHARRDRQGELFGELRFPSLHQECS